MVLHEKLGNTKILDASRAILSFKGFLWLCLAKEAGALDSAPHSIDSQVWISRVSVRMQCVAF